MSLFLQMMSTVSGENEFKPLTIMHLKTCFNTDHKTLKKAARQEAPDHYEKANENIFCQLTHDGDTLLNKDKHQAFGMHFAENNFCYNDMIALSFRKLLLYVADKEADLAEEGCNEHFELDFTHMFSYSAQDLSASTVSKELNAEKLECDMHQGDKVGASAFG